MPIFAVFRVLVLLTVLDPVRFVLDSSVEPINSILAAGVFAPMPLRRVNRGWHR